jgi:type I restriction enzyme S subunit
MELKPGYKQTEVGVIPEGWEVSYLKDVVEFTSGKPLEGSVKAGGQYNLITLDSIGINGTLKTEHKQTDTWDSSLMKGDIVAVLSDLAHGYLLGLCDIIPEDGQYVLNQRMARLRVRHEVDPRYIRAQINCNQSHFRQRGQGTSQRHIYKRDFEALAIPLPPLPEQKAIAQALSDMDALISGLDDLIAKKRDIKQATMQQLLTGKKRLPGFAGEWEVKRLGDVADMGSGGTPLSSVPTYYGGDIPWVSIADMTRCGKEIMMTDRYLTRSGFINSACQMFPIGTILYAMYASLGECSIAGISVCTSQAILGIRPKNALSNEFLYYTLVALKSVVKTLGQQGTQANLNKGMVQGFVLRLPSIPEQQAIAKVLTDMDAELDALEQRREKTRELKQAMMQELLTGRTRLV